MNNEGDHRRRRGHRDRGRCRYRLRRRNIRGERTYGHCFGYHWCHAHRGCHDGCNKHYHN